MSHNLDADTAAALAIVCTVCNAKPGVMCAGVVDASKTRAMPHARRLNQAKNTNDLERARQKRDAADRSAAFPLLKEAVLDSGPSEQLTTLAVALVKFSDACGLTREDLIDAFSQVARELPFSAVLE